MTTDPTKHPLCGTYEDACGYRIVICAVGENEAYECPCVGFWVRRNRGDLLDSDYWSMSDIKGWTKLSDELHMDPNWKPPEPEIEPIAGCYYEILVGDSGPIVAMCGNSTGKGVFFYPCKGSIEFYSIPFVTVIRGPLVPKWEEEK